jgi:hypothetical protein
MGNVRAGGSVGWAGSSSFPSSGLTRAKEPLPSSPSPTTRPLLNHVSALHADFAAVCKARQERQEQACTAHARFMKAVELGPVKVGKQTAPGSSFGGMRHEMGLTEDSSPRYGRPPAVSRQWRGGTPILPCIMRAWPESNRLHEAKSDGMEL